MTHNESMEERFDDLLNCYRRGYEGANTAINKLRKKPNNVLEREIKSFIRSEISLAVQEALRREREEIAKCINSMDNPYDTCDLEWWEGADTMKNKMLKLLSSRGKDNQEIICTCENTSQSSKSTAGLGGTYKCPIHYSNTKKCSSCGCIPHHLQTGLQGSNGACKCYCHNQTN